jgi:predicted DnaQ family exonuclease/DinG family helicase
MFNKPFVVLDLETSGIDPKSSDIIEVAMIRYEKGKEVGRYSDLIKIDYELPEIITAITSITDEMLLKKGKEKEDVLKKVEKMLKGAYLVGHNINFDFAFLQTAKVKMQISGLIDTVQLAQVMLPSAASYSLEALTDDLNISHEQKHRAMGDVEATSDLFEYLFKSANGLPKRLVQEIQDLAEKAEWPGGVFFGEVIGKSEGEDHNPRLQDKKLPNNPYAPKKPLPISEIFGSGGFLQRCKEGYEARPQQVVMAENVLNAFEQGYHLICEAPTGVGKSLAYLASAAYIAISNKSKVVISTNTINLQHQLFEKDIPLLQDIYKEATNADGPRVAVLKGRSHYLCLRRLAEFKRRPRFTTEEIILLIKILIWQYRNDGSDIFLSRTETLVWDFELCADQKYCSPQKCKAYGKCYLHEAREKAENADIIIVNHALLCSDLASGNHLLPDYQYLIIDEAHHFEEVATSQFGLDVKQENLAIPIKAIRSHLEDLERRFGGTLFVNNKAFELINPILEGIPDLQQSIDNFFNVVALFVNRNVPESGYIENLLIDQIITATEEWVNIGGSLADVSQKVMGWMKMLRQFADALQMTETSEQENFGDELMQEIGILSEQLAHLNDFFSEEHEGKKWIRWISSDLHGIVNIHLAPLMVGPYLKEALYDEKKSIILTSATLGVKLTQDGMDEIEKHPFTYLRQMLSLDDKFEEMILDSPFDFEKQAYIIIPSDLLPVQAKASIAQVSAFMASLIKAVGGSLMALFTAHNALENVYLNLMHELTPKDCKILAQRLSGGRNKIMKAYMNNPRNSALLGTASFWEGVDIAGDALTTLVIHKLPFDVPSDPVYKARSQMFSNNFMEYSVPRAILKFRQGFGRLIRSTKDYGVMICLDDRLFKKDYGQLFLQSLPAGVTIEKMPLADVPGKVKEWLRLMSNDTL